MHSIKFLLITCVSLFLIVGCGACGGNDMQKEGDTQMEEKAAPYPEPAPAPGSAKVKAEMVEMSETDTGYLCKMEVVEVNSVGRDAPPMIKGNTIEVFVAKNIADTEMLKKGGTYDVSLASQGDLMKESKASPQWRAVSIK